MEHGIRVVPHENYQLAYEENFFGNSLNMEDWMYRTGERLGGINLENNVQIEDGKLKIRFDYEEVDEGRKYTSGGIISKQVFGYGYYEAKGKLWGGSGGLHSSFWSMGLNGGDGVHTPVYNTIIEVDGYEVDSGQPTSIGTNIHYYIGAHRTVGGVIGLKEYTTIDTSKEEFVLGYEWLPNQINWYLNGTLIRTLKNPMFYGPQNVWLTALGCEIFDKNIDRNQLPGISEWEYFRYYNIDLVGVNLIVNPSFEYNKNKDFEKNYIRDMCSPIGWMIEGTDKKASRVMETEDAYDGECVLLHSYDTSYSVRTKVFVPWIVDGEYSLRAMVRAPKGGIHSMKAYGFGSSDKEVFIPMTELDNWYEISIEGIHVTKGECSIAFSSEAEAGQTLEVDQVCFMQTSGKENHTILEAFKEDEKKPYLPLDELIMHPTKGDETYIEYGEGWQASGLGGFLKSSRYAPCKEGTYAVWKPNLIQEGMYEVSFYNVCYENRASRAIVQLYHKHGMEQKEISQQLKSGWITFGSYEMDHNSYIKLLPGIENDSEFLATEAVKLETKDTKEFRSILEESILLKVGNNKALVQGTYTRIDKKNPRIVPTYKNGLCMVPLEFIAICLGASTFRYSEDKKAVEIFYLDHMVRVREGSNLVNVMNEDLLMEEECVECNTILYVPLKGIVKAFGWETWELDKGYQIISKKHKKLYKSMQLDLL